MGDDEQRVDWRGTPITEGALVIYGAPVGRSIQMVEAIVDGFTPSGRVWLKVVRRSYTGSEVDRVHVGADRLTIVTELPPTTMETDAEEREREAAERAERQRRFATHDEVRDELPPSPFHGTLGRRMGPPRCARCGVDGYAAMVAAECSGAPA